MNTNTKNKSLISIIVFLLITNIAMLLFFVVLNHPSQKTHSENGLTDVLKNEVGFNTSQLDQYQQLRKNHFDTVKVLFDNLKQSKESLFNLLYASQVTDSAVNTAADAIAARQRNLDMYMFRHFTTLRNICTPDQLQKFDTAIKKVVTRMISKPGGRDNHKH